MFIVVELANSELEVFRDVTYNNPLAASKDHLLDRHAQMTHPRGQRVNRNNGEMDPVAQHSRKTHDTGLGGSKQRYTHIVDRAT